MNHGTEFAEKISSHPESEWRKDTFATFADMFSRQMFVLLLFFIAVAFFP